MEILLISVFIKEDLHAKQIFVLSSSMNLGPYVSTLAESFFSKAATSKIQGNALSIWHILFISNSAKNSK